MIKAAVITVVMPKVPIVHLNFILKLPKSMEFSQRIEISLHFMMRIRLTLNIALLMVIWVTLVNLMPKQLFQENISEGREL